MVILCIQVVGLIITVINFLHIQLGIATQLVLRKQYVGIFVLLVISNILCFIIENFCYSFILFHLHVQSIFINSLVFISSDLAPTSLTCAPAVFSPGVCHCVLLTCPLNSRTLHDSLRKALCTLWSHLYNPLFVPMPQCLFQSFFYYCK